MRKLLILVVVTVLLFAGCVDEKAIKTSTEQPDVSPNAMLAQENETQKTDDSNQTNIMSPTILNDTQQPDNLDQADVVQPNTESDENTSATVTKETLQELEGLLEDLKQGDFTDIDFAE